MKIRPINRKHAARFAAFSIMLGSLMGCQNPKEVEEPLLFLPEDLQVTLWAESPMFHNPTNIDIDSRGRVWVAEAVNYRNYNNDSLRNLHHPEGDRIVVLEDTDGDGKADKSTTFAQDKDLVSPLGIAVVGNKVYVSCSPHLLVFTDDNKDDVPEKKEIFLTGFGGKDHDHSLHAMVGGPDGNLYFNTGNAGPHLVTDKSGWTLRSGSLYTGGSPYNKTNEGNMESDDGRVWVGGLGLKVKPDGTGLGVIAHNFRNAYELTVDSNGDVWQNDNDDQVVACRTTWVMEGGNAGYFSSDGTRYWQADQRPGQDVFTAHWHQEDPGVMPAGDRSGAGSPTGIVLNEGDALGEQYQGMLLSAEAGRNVVFGYRPVRERSGFDLGPRVNFVTSLPEDDEGYVWNDSLHHVDSNKWFRPSDVAVGTEGALYIADWYDPIVGGHQMADSTGYGRIYRITPRNKKLQIPTLDLTTTDGQLSALLSPAINVRYHAFQKLRAKGKAVLPEVKKILGAENPYHRARAIWLLAALGPEGVAEVEKLLGHAEEEVRVVAFRALRTATGEVLRYAQLLQEDPSPFVRRELIAAITPFPYAAKKPVLVWLLNNFDPLDRWYLEAIGTAVAGHEDDFIGEVNQIFNPDSKTPDAWNGQMEALVWRLHPVSYADQLAARASSENLTPAQRTRALTALGFINHQKAANAMVQLTNSENKAVAEQAAYWVSFRQGNDWFTFVDLKNLKIDPEHERKVAAMKVKLSKVLDEVLPYNEKKWNARDMAADPVGAKMLLATFAGGSFPVELANEVRETLLQHKNEDIRLQAAAHFGSSGDAAQYSIPEIAALNGDVLKGETLYGSKCAVCHRMGDKGRDIGPELTLIAKKFDRKALMEAIVDPTAGIVFGYEAWTITTTDGDSFYGFVIAEGKDVLVLKDLGGEKHNIEVSKIKTRQKAEKSLMPGAVALNLSDQDLADLSSFLLGLE